MNTFRVLLLEILRGDYLESLTIFYEHPPYKSRLKLRSSLYATNTYPYIHEDFADQLRYTGPKTTTFLLNYPTMQENLTLDRFMELCPTLTKEKITEILRHPLYKHFLYGITSPYDWANNLHGRLWGQPTLPRKHLPNNNSVYEQAQEVFLNERKFRISQNWNFLFTCILLRARIREFVERFWAPGNKKSLELKDSFYNSVKKIETTPATIIDTRDISNISSLPSAPQECPLS